MNLEPCGCANLVNLAMTFDPVRRNPARFQRDPKDPQRPSQSTSAPARPITDTKMIGQLFQTGNEHYASFIQSCKIAAGDASKVVAGIETGPDNRMFLTAEEVGITDHGVKSQEPYAAVLGCIDSRVPVELVIGQASNDVFVVRTAGNILTLEGEASGSMHYILSEYAIGSAAPKSHHTLTAILVLGHTRCGAVAAAYEAYKTGGSGTTGMPPSLISILEKIKWSVKFVEKHRPDLTDPDEIKNAISAVNAFHSHVIVQRLAKNAKCNKGLKVYFGTYNVDDFRICMTNLPSPRLPAAKVMDAFDYSKDGELILEQPLIDLLAAGALDFAKSQMGEVVAGRSSLNPSIDPNRA